MSKKNEVQEEYCECPECEEYLDMLGEILHQFGIRPTVELTKNERKVLKAISKIDDADIYDICDYFDICPSKAEKYIIRLEDKGVVDYYEDSGELFITNVGVEILTKNKKQSKVESKFIDFLVSLDPDELAEFAELCSAFEGFDECCCEDDDKCSCEDDHECCCEDDHECCCEDDHECCCEDDHECCCEDDHECGCEECEPKEE